MDNIKSLYIRQITIFLLKVLLILVICAISRISGHFHLIFFPSLHRNMYGNVRRSEFTS